ncbi:energy-coupling factor ABC transporter permease [Sulfurospirillum arcachonense]|uniref:energy-coupling factor ABC transporter permease n=1 Tax=Sulfurospirillum arcachonense TaxID=57666 RepID=UPI0004682B88|nr:energy-coupling factor ABC transporter permease [Sulfurospirillum arcachonense]
MHIEAGVVVGAKMLLSYGTAAGVLGVSSKLAFDSIKESGLLQFIVKTILTTLIVFCCFEVLPHYAVGVSEVHLILGTTIFLIFGIAPAAFGLALGLLIQGLFFAQFDLPQYGMNVTTLLASMLALNAVIRKIIPKGIAYKDISYTQMLKMSIVWEGAIVSWVAFWAFYGQGFGSENIANVLSFGSAYMSVIIIEPLIDLAVLSAVKAFNVTKSNVFFDKKLIDCKA